MPEAKTLTLYLTDWQKRMVKDYVKSGLRPANLTKVMFGLPTGSIRTYRVPNFEEAKLGGWNLYLNDEQIRQVVEFTRIKTRISALFITPQMVEKKVVVFE